MVGRLMSSLIYLGVYNMLNLKNLTDDQRDAVDRIYENDNTLLVADMGAGKTVVSLTAVSELLRDNEIKRVLVISTIKIATNVWKTETKKWDHLKHLDIALAIGDADARSAAIESDNNIVCINFENVRWFVEKYKIHDFDGLVIDEVTKLKGGGSNFKALRKIIREFKYRLCMTGTPISESWSSLFALMLLTDTGKALGRNKTKFLEKYFYPTDYERRNWKLIPGQEKEILSKIGSCLYYLPDYRHLLPPLKEIEIRVPMDDHTEIMYANFKRDCIAVLNDDEVSAPNAAALSGKLQQVTQGFIYSENDVIHKLTPHKLHALKELPCIKNKLPTMVIYWFKQDRAYLLDAFPDAVDLSDAASIAAWNAGTVPVLLCQPRSCGHGLNLSEGGCNIVFYSQLWSGDLTKQAIGRLYRRNQTQEVTVTYLMLEKSIDYLMRNRVENKAAYHRLLLEHLTS